MSARGSYQQFDDQSLEMEARGHCQDVPLSISQLNWYIKNVLEQAVPKVWVEGEVSDLSRPSSGHIYFSLKDEKSQVRAVIWRSTANRMPFQLKDGLSIICCGAVEVYPPRGSYQLIINQVQPKGVGPLQLAFQQLHQKLSAQGLFDPQRKRSLPKFPRRIGFITSPSGAAAHDFFEAAKGLWSQAEILLIPARVQGELAADDIVRAVQNAERLRRTLDVLVIARGGGSIEDLWCFNEERVVRAISAVSIPVVSAIGHEIDVTLSDLAADARALTPTHAAQLILPSRLDMENRLFQLQRRMQQAVRSRTRAMKARFQGLVSRGILARPHEIHRTRRQMVDELEIRGRRAARNLLAARSQRLSSLIRATEALSPLNVLARGFSLSHKADSTLPIRSYREVALGDQIHTRLQDGVLISQVQSAHASDTVPQRPIKSANSLRRVHLRR
jgi:exodeoxyribonuclease VII large subunit